MVTKGKGRRYLPQLKSLAISIYHTSGKAYRMLSKLFILLTKTSLRRYISKLPATPGFSQGTLNIIKSKVSHMNEEEKICSLCMDEISLKTNLYYDIPGDKIVGLDDLAVITVQTKWQHQHLCFSSVVSQEIGNNHWVMPL